MLPPPPSFALRYSCAVVSVALAIGMRLLLDPVLGDQFPFATIFLAVFVTAWYGGFRPALAAVVLGGLAANFFLLQPRLSLELTSPEQQVGMALYFFIGFGISALTGLMHAERRRAELNVVERKIAEESLREANDKLEARVRERTAELSQINDRLRASEEHFRAIVEGVRSHAIFMLDPNGNVASWNRGSERIKGYKAAEILGQHFSRFYTAEDVASGKPQRGLEHAAAEGCFEEEGIRIRKDGSRFWAIVTITPLYDHVPELTGFLKVTRDVSERKAIANELQEAARFNRAVLDGLSAHIAILDEDGTIFAVNKSWNEFGAANGLARGRGSVGDNYLAVCDRSVAPHAEEGPLVAAGIRAVLAGTTAQFDAEYPCHGPAQQRWFIVRVTRFPGDGRHRAIVAHENITQRKLAEDALREERDKFATIVAAVPVVICSYRQRADGSSCFPFANPAIEHIYGIRPEDLAKDALPIFSRVHPDDLDRVQTTLNECGRTMTPWRGEFRVRNPERGELWVEGHVIPTAEPNGSILWQGYIADVTERIHAEEARKLFRELIDRSNDAIEVIDPATGRFLDGNEKAWQSLGYSRDEFLTLRVSDIDPVQAVRSWSESVDGLRSAGFVVCETEHRRKDGSTFPVEVNSRYVQLKREYAVAVVRDITERKRTEAESHQQQARLEGIVDSAMDGIITIDEDQRIVLTNSAAERMFGCRAEDVLGESVDRFIPGRFRAGHAEHVRQFGQTGIAARAMGRFGPISGLRANGEEFPIEASISQIEVDGHKLFTVTCRDVTERIRAAETTKKLEAQLQQSQKMEAFGQLAGGVAHDFNNLLTVICGYSEMLTSLLPPDDVKTTMIREIGKAGERAVSLTRQLLAFSRQQVLEPRVLDLNVVVAETEKMLRRLIGEDVQLATVLRPGISSVKVDPGQIDQVIMNLAVNARDAMPQGGKLTIETSEVELDESYPLTRLDAIPGRFVELAISDTGAGMTPEVKARLFEPFFTTKGVGKGTGLGLAVVHGIVKQSGGRIEVYSEVGAGTTFKIYLPAVQEQAGNLLNARQTVPSRGTETILLVEDEAGVRDYAVAALEGFGYTVLKATGGRDALDLLAKGPTKVDLLVTDVVMPGMSGRQLAETLRLRDPSFKVLFLSGYTDDAIVRHGVLQADVAFLQKPFTPNSLARKVREALDQ